MEFVGVAENMTLSLDAIRVLIKWEQPSINLEDKTKQAEAQLMDELYQDLARIPDIFLWLLLDALAVDFLLYERAKVLLKKLITKPKT